uniref:Uncharacterized protein n=1 Tax=Rhizophagus irregularis (strain DAOM 181602 / DAOM 197198 / MUCL 43194) TaxID=747089 RepID=U9UFU9_RHIID
MNFSHIVILVTHKIILKRLLKPSDQSKSGVLRSRYSIARSVVIINSANNTQPKKIHVDLE